MFYVSLLQLPRSETALNGLLALDVTSLAF